MDPSQPPTTQPITFSFHPLALKTCTIRPCTEADIPAYARAANSPLIAKWMRNVFPNPYTLKDAENWVAYCQSSNPLYDYCIADRASDTVIGGIGLKPSVADEVNALSWEVGYWVAEEHWGRGVATEVLRAFCAWCFEEIRVRTRDGLVRGLERLTAVVFSGNEGSLRVLGKCGFLLEGVRRRAVVKDGVVLDEVHLGLTREDHSALSRRK